MKYFLLPHLCVQATDYTYSEDVRNRDGADSVDIDQVRKQFDTLDLNGDGMLDGAEVRTAFGPSFDAASMFELFSRQDLDESGTITLEEYLGSVLKKNDRTVGNS
jgi:Ca2+-binding EF-hand superfamily protein